MIAPLIPYGIRGAIWYQGESNAGQAYEYRTLFTTMIQDWRTHWKQGDFPFLCVQLAPYQRIVDKPTESDWAELREAQLLATKNLPKVGMAVITDVGEQNDIHPKKKEPVARGWHCWPARLPTVRTSPRWGRSTKRCDQWATDLCSVLTASAPAWNAAGQN